MVLSVSETGNVAPARRGAALSRGDLPTGAAPGRQAAFGLIPGFAPTGPFEDITITN